VVTPLIEVARDRGGATTIAGVARSSIAATT